MLPTPERNIFRKQGVCPAEQTKAFKYLLKASAANTRLTSGSNIHLNMRKDKTTTEEGVAEGSREYDQGTNPGLVRLFGGRTTPPRTMETTSPSRRKSLLESSTTADTRRAALLKHYE